MKYDVMKFWCFFVYVFFSRWPLNLSILRESWVVTSFAITGFVLICVFNSDPIVTMKFCALEFGAYMFRILKFYWLTGPLIRMNRRILFILFICVLTISLIHSNLKSILSNIRMTMCACFLAPFVGIFFYLFTLE